MVRRHKRRKFLTDIERERFVQEATELHHKLNANLMALTPLSGDYRAILKLSEALRNAIRDVTGDEPEWCKVQCSWFPG